MKEPDVVLAIHYSCEGFANRPHGLSPRATSIAVTNVGTAQAFSFSIHQVAETEGLAAASIPSEYNRLERAMLDDFYAFVGRHGGHWWVHWNMRDANYGFLALEHRYRVLAGTPTDVPEAKRLDLASLMHDMYGSRYAGHPRLASLVGINEITSRDFLSGAAEAEAFDRGEYPRLHLSTLRKSGIIGTILQLVHEGRLKTNAPWGDTTGHSLLGFIDVVTEHWLFKLVGLVCIGITLAQGLSMIAG